MIVVSDTSPVTNLIECGLLHLLPKLYGKVIVPELVQIELAELIHHDRAYDVTIHPWIEVRKAIDERRVADLSKRGLDAGESEAIVLAQELSADLLLIDEKRGRKVADDLGLAHVGVLGILVAAKSRGHICEVAPIVRQLREEIGFWVSDEVVEYVLAIAGEGGDAGSG